MQTEPRYYSSLGPFRALFNTSVPILTWHKLGRRPRHARLKGMYLRPQLFAQQLAELRQAGFSSASLAEAAATAGNSHQHIILTFDDGYVNVLVHGLKLLARNRFTAIQFLVADRLGQSNIWDVAAGEVPEPLMTVAQGREWLAAGHSIGSHTLTHPFLTRLPLEEAREQITASKKKLEDLFGRAIEHFCYPYGDWNPAVRELVAEAGYRTACTTEFGVNPLGVSPYALKRITARYRTRNFKAALAWFRQWLPGRGN